ncbi:MAG: glutathione S-transferase N-terminal domain-containing protein, partial [Hyphomicrobium sp.]|nr:glutathione S-transferase N-terminal domain-containing protein [Hyphomicrobium sp.]
MKLYLTPHACSLAVDIVARELEIPLDLEWVDVRAKRLRDGSDYFAVNPKGQVPTLELPDGQYLTEGPVIVQYLADLRPRSGLLAPVTTLDRYRVLEWLNFIGSEL